MKRMFWKPPQHFGHLHLIYSGETAVGGELTNQLTGQYHSNSNRWLEFDAYENLTS